MRKDAKKNLKKVATAAIKDPLKTEREIAKEAGVSKGTAHNMLGKLGQSIDRSSTIVAIEETDLELVTILQSKMLEWARNLGDPKKDDVAVANQVARESQKRYSMLSGENTNEEGGEREHKFVIHE